MWINYPSAKFVWSNQTIINYRIRLTPPLSRSLRSLVRISSQIIRIEYPSFWLSPLPNKLEGPREIFTACGEIWFPYGEPLTWSPVPCTFHWVKLSVQIVGEIQNRHCSHKPESDHILGERRLLQSPYPPLKSLEISLMTSYPCNLTVKICESHI
jgi:hypothetical protein